ncbi:Metallo-dependent phosphatase-like protein [Lasiosphaeria hispida]|uniref:Metallo-dependent phosphatase-like protein n=1 Tax=Lasiosphaeria hispida TaxID=260671 RepID=A0AAJ0HCM4_9PEZI|nr:Metallo-dependent phosphatase-like protein [Lasiosphaeria hispida]
MPATVQILSDLHLEAPPTYDDFEVVPKAPYLGLLGDIGTIEKHKDECLKFLTAQLKQFRAVLFVPGNHEAYHSDWPTTLEILRNFEHDVARDESLGDFVLLDRAVFRLDENTAILGCSLFSHVPPERYSIVRRSLNDFYQTRDWNVALHNEAHERDLAWLNQQVAALDEAGVNMIILSHWSPSTDSRAVEPRHAGSDIATAFSTDLSGEVCFQSARVKAWAFGHTHYNCDFEAQRGDGVAPLRILTNQRGYTFATAEGFDEEKTVAC